MCSRFRSYLAYSMLLFPACNRQPDRVAAAGNTVHGNRQSDLRAGPPLPRPVAAPRAIEKDEAAIGEGKRLYSQFNCAGCHAGGGGAIGPPLMDDQWIYGGSLSNIFWTIVEGRPQGMPAFGGRIAEHQIWQLAAYVRSLSGPVAETPGVGGEASRGKTVFLQGSCAMCHTIRGTRALSKVGPDLTHLASRKRIAAGTLPNTRGNLAGWILNPQNLKPGTRMPPTLLESGDLHALLTYLETLQ